MKKALLILSLGILLIAGLVAISSKPTNETPPEGLLVEVGTDIGNIAPNFSLKNLEGEIVELSDFQGRVVMLDFWAVWCPFCKHEFPEMESAYKKYSEDGFVILGVHRTATEPIAVAESFIDELGISFPILSDEKDEVYEKFIQVNVMPASIFVDREGIIQNIIYGPKDITTLEEEIMKLL